MSQAELNGTFLGRLLVIQSTILSLPDEKTVFEFTCRGLEDFPGVSSAHMEQKEDDKSSIEGTLKLPIEIRRQKWGLLVLTLKDRASIEPYLPFLKNLAAMIAIILEDRRQVKISDNQKLTLHKKVETRSAELAEQRNRRILAESLHAHSDARFRAIFEKSGIGILVVDSQGNFVEVNPAIKEITGYEREELIGNNFAMITHPDDIPLSQEAVRTLLCGERDQYHFEKRYISREGKTIVAKLTVAIVRGETTETSYFITMLEDITKQKAADQELERYRNNLESLVNEQTQDLIEAKEIAENANQAKSEFLAKMSHELRTPLNPIIGFAEMMLHDESITKNPENKEFLLRISRSAEHLLSLINDILDLSKIEAGKMEFLLAPIEFPGFIEEVAQTARLMAKKTGNKFSYRFSTKLETINTDATRLRQVLFNLLTNACKFTDNGTIDLEVYCDSDDTLMLIVSDTGRGISPDGIKNLFHDFSQVDRDHTDVRGGAGLGLSISKKIVEIMGGSIDVSSQLGEGSVFTVSLPLKSSPPN